MWVRAQNGETSRVVETVSGSPQPLTADTVVVLSVAERSAGYTDSAGTEVTTYDVIGFGDAKVFHDGRVVEGRWLRSAQEDPWVLVDDVRRPHRSPCWTGVRRDRAPLRRRDVQLSPDDSSVATS